jgi:DNA-binding NarL/FixJ family response regulator
VGVLDAMADHASGAVALAQGDAEAALPPLKRALSTWLDVGAPYIAARIRVLVGRACDALGDADSAQLQWDAAREVFERLGARLDLERAPSPAPRADHHGLTPRELEVLRWVATGKTNKAIAHELSVSERTVDRHVSNILSKLDVGSRAAATAYAHRSGLV